MFPEATDEQVNALLNIRGKEVNEANATIEGLRNQLSAANGQLEEFNKAKSEQMTQEERLQQLIQEVEQQKRDNAIGSNRIKAEAILSGIGLTGEDASGQLDLIVSEDPEATLKRAQTFADLITAQREAVKSETEKSMLSKMGHPEGKSGKGEVTKEQFSKMTYSQKLEIKQNQPELFKTLSS